MISNLEINGKSALVFDTGLSAKAFAQAKLTYFVTEKGYIVLPDGSVREWRPDGVVEINGSMAVWGADFAGTTLLSLIEDETSTKRDAALNALRFCMSAYISLNYRVKTQPPKIMPALTPSTSFISPNGEVLFCPPQIAQRSIEADGNWIAAAERWIHPDLLGETAATFTAAALLYRLFSGMPPFPATDVETLHQDIREVVCLPLRLAVPGLNADLAALVMEALTATDAKRPELARLRDFLGAPNSAQTAPTAASYIQPLSAEERAKIEFDRTQFQKNSALTVKTKRFIGRNSTILAIALAAVLGIGLMLRGIISDRANQPTTKGMTPAAVTETFYGAFGTLDHQLMDTCVLKKAAKADIDMVTNFFVLSRVRQAYEAVETVIPAQEWVDAGSPPTETTIFGVSDLTLELLDSDESDGETTFIAAYRLWLPGGYRPRGPEEPEIAPFSAEAAAPLPPWGIRRTDTVRLIWNKDAWLIAEITRADED
jgi:hypothetical protein